MSDTAPGAPVIELRGIKKSYGELDVIRGVDLTARRGDVVALIGSSGSGKSTLLRCVNLLETAQDGDVIFDGEPVTWRGTGQSRAPADPSQVRRFRTNLSMVFQQFNLWSHLSVLDNVAEAPVSVLKLSRIEAAQRAQALLNKVGIGDKAAMYPSQLSGGQQQRAAIARALAMEPAAMLFDEPTSALDPETEAEVVQVIRTLAAEGRTMLLVTHDMKMARDCANHVIFLHQGVIEEEGPPDQVFGATRSARLKQFLSSTH
ncbi:MAG: amino acid ABC transporter ATP-binding protein [Pseudomonadota bacterium]